MAGATVEREVTGPTPEKKARLLPGPPAASRPIAVALAGAGFIAETHLAVLRQLGNTEVVGVCDPNLARAEALARRWSIPLVGKSVADLLRQRRPDVLHVLVPPPWHFEVARQALDARLHVFVEKPLALRGDECAELADVARARGVLLGVNHNFLHHPLYLRLRQDLAAYRLGKVQHVVSTHSLPLRQLATGEHDHWMFREPANILFEQAVHPLSQICDLLGPVRQVTTTCSGEQVLRSGTGFRTRWQLALVCEQGTAQVYLSFGRSFAESRVDVIGQDGVAHLDLLGNIYVLDRRTKYFDAIDRFRRCLSQGRQAAWCGVRNFVRYGLSMLRLAGRSDPFYLSMRDSIADYYRTLREGGESKTVKVGRLVIEGLEQATRTLPPAGNSGQGPVVVGQAFLLAQVQAGKQGCLPYDQKQREGEVLILGGTGFIGRRLVAALARAGQPVRLLVRQPALPRDLAEDCPPSICIGDVRNGEDVRRVVQGCRAVVHLVSGAPERWPDFEKLFVEGTRHVAEACLQAKVPQLLFASSIAAYYLGRARETITEQTPLDDHPHRRSLYARAKIACESLLTDLHRSRGLQVTIFRPGVVVGPGGPVEHGGVGFWPAPTHCVSWGWRTGRPLPFVLVDDVVAALVSALGKSGLEGKSFNLVGDVRLSAAEYVDILRAESRRDVRLHRQSLPGWWLIDVFKWAVKAAARKPENAFPSWRDLATRSLAARFDCGLAKELLGWKPVADREEFIERGIRQALREAL
jgi:predicted dehydrogenase/nucleoside-diphosphate-sugar epimerase